MFSEVNSRSGGHSWKTHDRQNILIFSVVFLTRRNPPLSVGMFLAGVNLKFLLDSKAQRRESVIINNLVTERPLRHFTDQTTEATISECGSIVQYSIRMKMEIIKRVLINAFYFTRVNFS